jgi:hypothetical protein
LSFIKMSAGSIFHGHCKAKVNICNEWNLNKKKKTLWGAHKFRSHLITQFRFRRAVKTIVGACTSYNRESLVSLKGAK